MSLLGLPTELIQRIVKETIPEDFEPVVLSCRQLHDISSIFLQQYNLRKKRFRHFTLSTCGAEPAWRTGNGRSGPVRWDNTTEATGIKVRSVPELLLYIAEDPTVARYIQSLDIKDDNYYHDHDRKDHENPTLAYYQHIKDNPEKLMSLVRESPYLHEAGVDPDEWMARMLDDKWMHEYGETTATRATVLLLTLLPNVIEVTPERDWGAGFHHDQREDLFQVLDAIVQRANDKRLPSASLSKVELVKPCVGTGYECRRSLSPFAPLLALDSLREFYAGSCIFKDDGYTGFAFHPRYEVFGANLEKIELVGSVGRHHELAGLLSRTPKLKCFHLAYETKWHGCGHNWNVGAFLNTIQEQVGDTLEELSVTILSCYGGKGTTLDNMRDFKKLKLIELDVEMLMGPAFNKFSEHEEWLDEEGPPGDAALPRLVGMLPVSIETVRIYNINYLEKPLECVRSLYDRFEKERDWKLPHLRHAELVSPEPENEGERTEDALRTLGAVRNAGGTVKLEKNARACHPWFATHFLERFGVEDW